jgi:hypothetical protein
MSGMAEGTDEESARDRPTYLTQDPDWWYGDSLRNCLPPGGLVEKER